MIEHDYLLIIDQAPVDEKLQNYFKQFAIQIIQKKNLKHFTLPLPYPYALLINWSILHNSLTIIQQVCSHPIPLIVLSDSENEEASIQMLELGADDFMIKPIHPRELHARISAIHRRVQRAIQPFSQGKEVFLFANWRLYATSRQVYYHDTELLLTSKEFDLLLAFVRQPQQVISRKFLATITENKPDSSNRRIDMQISRLRHKINIDMQYPHLIQTIRNQGYMLTVPVILG